MGPNSSKVGGSKLLYTWPTAAIQPLSKVPPEVSTELSNIVQKLKMNGEAGSSKQQEVPGMRDRVSRLDSYIGYSDASLSAVDGAKGVAPRSLQEKFRWQKLNVHKTKR